MSCLNDDSCSSSITISPRCGVGAKIALRAPTTTCTSPAAIRCQCQCRSASVRWLCSTATWSNRARNRCRVCGVRLISGTSTIACRPKPTHFLDRLNVDFGLAAAGDAVHQNVSCRRLALNVDAGLQIGE